MSTENAAMIVDCRGLQCPMPILRTAQAIKTLEPGQLVRVLATDPGFAFDVKAWASRSGNELVSAETDGDGLAVVLRRGLAA